MGGTSLYGWVVVSDLSLHDMHNCPSISVLRVVMMCWNYTLSWGASGSFLSIHVWWWSALINQWRLVGRVPAVKTRHLKRRGSFTSVLPTSAFKKRRQEGNNQHFISSPCFRLEREKQVPGGWGSQSDTTKMLHSWPQWTQPLWKASRKSPLWQPRSERGGAGECFESSDSRKLAGFF